MIKTRHRDGTAHEAQLASGCGPNGVVGGRNLALPFRALRAEGGWI